MFNWRASIRKTLPKPLIWKVAPMRLSWAAGPDAEHENFGDELSPLIINRLFGVRVKHSGISTADMIGLGSLLDGVEEHVDRLRPYIWGTGFIQDGPVYSGNPLQVLAVRGRHSLSRLGSMAPHSTALGDPGILTSLAFPSLRDINKRYHITVIPHFVDNAADAVAQAAMSPDVHVANVFNPSLQVLKEICESEIVFSSSLHGLIVSESFGIPNYWTPLSNNVIGSGYKFRDYYSAFGESREPRRLYDALSEASSLLRSWRALSGITEIQDGLLGSFPYILPDGVEKRSI